MGTICISNDNYGFLICNRDRHGANIEILSDEKEKARPAPLFVHGLSFRKIIPKLFEVAKEKDKKRF